MTTSYVFVYGTLMSGMDATALLSGSACLVCRGTIQGRLYDLGAYPAAVASAEPADTVAGELYELASEETIGGIDGYEGYRRSDASSLFRREAVVVRRADGGQVTAWTYFFARPLPRDARRISSGDYRLARERSVARPSGSVSLLSRPPARGRSSGGHPQTPGRGPAPAPRSHAPARLSPSEQP